MCIGARIRNDIGLPLSDRAGGPQNARPFGVGGPAGRPDSALPWSLCRSRMDPNPNLSEFPRPDVDQFNGRRLLAFASKHRFAPRLVASGLISARLAISALPIASTSMLSPAAAAAAAGPGSTPSSPRAMDCVPSKSLKRGSSKKPSPNSG